jgi:transcriptional regulator with XRE-family HTH domain
VGERIRYILKQKEWTQDKLSQETGLSKSFLSEVINDRTNISGENLLKVAEALNTTLDYLMKGSSQEKFIESKVIEIPKPLDELAEEEHLSYVKVIRLLEADSSLQARRSSKERHEFTKEEWRNFYNKLKDYL